MRSIASHLTELSGLTVLLFLAAYVSNRPDVFALERLLLVYASDMAVKVVLTSVWEKLDVFVLDTSGSSACLRRKLRMLLFAFGTSRILHVVKWLIVFYATSEGAITTARIAAVCARHLFYKRFAFSFSVLLCVRARVVQRLIVNCALCTRDLSFRF